MGLGRERLYDKDFLLKCLSRFPQTYKSLLKKFVVDGTVQVVVRRKLNILFKEGRVCKCWIPTSRFHKALYYVFPKDYHILVLPDRLRGCSVVVFFEFRRVGEFWLSVPEFWRLSGSRWVKCKGKKFFMGNVIRWV